MNLRKILIALTLIAVLLLGGWSLLHRDEIHSPGDFFRLAGDQISRVRDRFAPSRIATWRAGSNEVIRIASFNIRGLDEARLGHPHLESVLARVVTSFDVVALQEVCVDDPWLLTRFLKRLGEGQYDYVMGLPDASSSERVCNVLVYNRATIELVEQRHYTVNDPDNLIQRKPLVAWFRTRTANVQDAFTFSLVNVQLNPLSPKDELLQIGPVFRAVRSDGRGEDDVIMIGDFGVPAAHLAEATIGGGLAPLVRYVATSTAGDAQPDNVLIDSIATSEFSGEAGVLDFMKICNLTLAEAQMVSDHLPVWAEFYVHENTRPGRVARANPGAPDQR
jgi:endonuclease/exonuclease/phosphatase family metal-dependent hydrolase